MGCHRVKYSFLGYFVAFQKRQSFLLSIPTEIYEYIYIFVSKQGEFCLFGVSEKRVKQNSRLNH